MPAEASYFLLFIYGLAAGSFLNVVSLRYESGKFILRRESTVGRSRCPKCESELRWFELIPLLSFIVQFGRCRHCGQPISLQYPIVEFLSGLIFVLVPWRLQSVISGSNFYVAAALWIAIFWTLLLLSLIDLRLRIIPDEANIFLAVLGVGLAFLFFKGSPFSLVGSYSSVFGGQAEIWLGRLLAAIFSAALFGLLILTTRGRGMGAGDLKLAAALALVFGWPDVLFVVVLGFIIGAVYGVIAVTSGRKKMKSIVPFGPFLAASSAAIFFLGYIILDFCFRNLVL